MRERLKKGKKLKTILGEEVVIDGWLAEGGQGDVYRVAYGGETKVLKWYKPQKMGKDPENFYKNLKNNMQKGAPSKEFLWPLDVTQWEDGVFGYVMDLKPKGFYEVSDFMLTNVRFKNYRVAVDAALHIVTAYRILHNNGYSYQDLNDGNFFINPETGEVLICDNDNVAPDNYKTGIIGKPRYMAPEIVMKKNMPNTLSDIFSMSVILYILFCMNHPLEGKRSLVNVLPPELQERLYGEEALFIMDKEDKSNAPDPKIHKNSITMWKYLPGYMKEIFYRAFSQAALKNPNLRPVEAEWVDALVRFRNDIVLCQCKNNIFIEENGKCLCDGCGKSIKIPYWLKLAKYNIPGIVGSKIYRCQLGPCNADKALDELGGIGIAKADPDNLRLINLTEKSWNVTNTSGVVKHVKPKETIVLRSGINIMIDTGIKVETIEIVKKK